MSNISAEKETYKLLEFRKLVSAKVQLRLAHKSHSMRKLYQTAADEEVLGSHMIWAKVHSSTQFQRNGMFSTQAMQIN